MFIKTKNKEDGFTLLEVLIAFAVISVALLGIGGVQAFVINNTGAAKNSSVASLFASSLAANIGANRAYWGGGYYGIKSDFAPPSTLTVKGATISNTVLNNFTKNCADSVCNPEEMAAYDLKMWGKELKTVLPEGEAAVRCASNAIGLQDSSPQYLCTIEIIWFEKNVKSSLTKNPSIPKFTQQTYKLTVQQ